MVIHWSRFRKEVVFYEKDSPQGIWDHFAEKMLVEFAENGCPIFRATTPLSRCKLKSKGHGKLSIHFAADQKTIETSFRMIVSANQLRGQHNAQALAAVPRHQITEDLGMRNSSWCSGGSVRHDGRTFAAFVECTTHSPFVVLDIRIVGSSSGPTVHRGPSQVGKDHSCRRHVAVCVASWLESL